MDSVERCVLGMILNDHDNLAKSMDLGVGIDCFGEPTHRVIWEAICNNKVEHLRAGYPNLINELREEAPLTQNVEYYASALFLAYLRLELAWNFMSLSTRILKHQPFDPLGGIIQESVALNKKLLDLADKHGPWSPKEIKNGEKGRQRKDRQGAYLPRSGEGSIPRKGEPIF